MTTTAHSMRTPTRPRNTGVTFPRVVRSEWIKLRSLRSTVWCYAIIALLTVGFGLLLATTYNAAADATLPVASQRAIIVQVATLGVNFTQLVAAVLGVLMVTGEYSTGMIRSTFTAVPARLPAFFAKALVLALTTFIVSAVSISAAALVTAPILAGKGVGAHLMDSAVLWALLGGAGYLTLIAILALTLGAILRNSAGGIASALGLVLVVPPVLRIVSSITHATWISNVSAFLPSEAGGKMYSLGQVIAERGPGAQATQTAPGLVSLDGTQGFLVLLAWIVVLGVAAAMLLKRRDA